MEENNKKSFREKLLNFKQKAENNIEQEKIEKQNKIKFYKKICYSITKFSKYPEMAKEGVKDATKYLVGIIAFFSIFLSIISTVKMKKSDEEGIEYLNKNLPEINYSEGILIAETKEKIVLEHDLVKELVKGIVIIDTNIDDEEIINKYIDDIGIQKRAVILLKDKLITVNWKKLGEHQEYNYQELLKTYSEKTSIGEVKKITKNDVMYYVENNLISIIGYFIRYFISYVIIYFGDLMIDIGVVCVIGYITNKIIKLGFKIKEIYSMTVYSYTLPIIIYILYTIIHSFTNFNIPYFIECFMMLAYIFLTIALFKSKHNGEKKEGEN